MLWQVRAGCRGSVTAWRCGVGTCSHVQYCSREPPLSAPCRWRHRDPAPSPSAWLIAHMPSGLLPRPWRVVVECQSRWILFRGVQGIVSNLSPVINIWIFWNCGPTDGHHILFHLVCRPSRGVSDVIPLKLDLSISTIYVCLFVTIYIVVSASGFIYLYAYW